MGVRNDLLSVRTSAIHAAVSTRPYHLLCGDPSNKPYQSTMMVWYYLFDQSTTSAKRTCCMEGKCERKFVDNAKKQKIGVVKEKGIYSFWSEGGNCCVV